MMLDWQRCAASTNRF